MISNHRTTQLWNPQQGDFLVDRLHWSALVGSVCSAQAPLSSSTHRELQLFIFDFARCLVCEELFLPFSSSEGSLVQVEIPTCQLHLRMFLSPAPHPPTHTPRKGLGFADIQAIPASCKSVSTSYCIRLPCQPSDLTLWNLWRYWSYIVVVC